MIIQSSRQGLKLLLHNWQMLETVTDGETLNGTVGFVFITSEIIGNGQGECGMVKKVVIKLIHVY